MSSLKSVEKKKMLLGKPYHSTTNPAMRKLMLRVMRGFNWRLTKEEGNS